MGEKNAQIDEKNRGTDVAKNDQEVMPQNWVVRDKNES